MKLRTVYISPCVYLLILVLVVSSAPGRKKMGSKAVDECKTGRSDCHKDAHCYNTRRSYRCKCKRGFYGNGKICHDENECEFENGGCVHYCANTRGNYTCSCKPGFQVARDGHNCIDKNECFYNKGGCQHQCINTLGKYECKCNAGYSLHANGKRCIPGTWCQDELGCAHHCQSSANGMVCACRRGYRLHQNGKDCIATCVVGNGGCQHECTNTASGPVCTCHKKYMLRADGKTCTATCGVNNGGCDRRCEDTPKGPRCSCPPGYVLHQDGKTCLDVDECRHKNGGCSHACVNAHGSYECICPKGFKVQHDQKTCSDVNECSLNTTCDHICVNSPGSYKCGCRRGFQKYGKSHCADQNECSKNNGGCEHRCRNVIGGYECLCNEGFKLHHNKKDCVVAAKCLPLKAPAKSVLQCHTRGREERCTLQCQKNSHFAAGSEEKYVVTCGNSTDYMWTHERNNTSLPSCSETIAAPGFRRRACFLMPTAQCKLKKKMKDDFRNNLSQTVVGQNKYKCTEMCEVNYVRLQCGTRRRKFRRKAKKDKVALIRAEFELQVKPQNPTERCNMQCVHDRTQRRLKRTIKRLKKSINRGQFSVKLDGQHYHVTKNSFKASRQQLMCNLGQVLVKDKCVSCSIGSYFDISLQKCDFCPPGTYQNKEGQLSCIPCPNAAVHEGGVQGARNVSECGGQCNPGNYSDDGFEPCTPCRKGTYQPDYGRTTCVSCGPGIITRKSGARGFQDCIVKDKCRPGHYYNMKKQRCEQCSRATYQPAYGQNFCIDCPGNTTTDSPGSVNSTDCKDRRCGGVLGKTQGFIQSPNWPGPYPSNVECTWTIVPEKGRRILVVIPEIFLAAGNKCGDILVMRKSSSPYSLTTYETCESTETPIAFTARSKKLWIRFKTDNKGLSAAGFSIPYVTYNEEYQDLIEDIVRDGRLYSSHQHQEVLKDRKLLSALLDVIAIPYNYFKYYNQSETMFPESFIRLLTPKVRRFFSN